MGDYAASLWVKTSVTPGWPHFPSLIISGVWPTCHSNRGAEFHRFTDGGTLLRWGSGCQVGVDGGLAKCHG